MKKQLDQNGFSAVMAILIVIIIGLIGFTGWYVYNSNQNNNKVIKNTGSYTPPKTSVASLEINEWGVKVVFKDADKVTYTLSEDKNSASLSLKDEVTNIAECKPLSVAIERGTSKNEERSRNVKFGNYYYWVSGGPGACLSPTDPNKSIDQLRSEITSTELSSFQVQKN